MKHCINLFLFFLTYKQTNKQTGIGARGTRLTHEKILSEEKVQLVDPKKNEVIKLPAGIHRFPFAFIVPNVSASKSYFSEFIN